MSNLSRVKDAHERRENFIEMHGKSRMLEIKILYLMWKNKDWNQLGFETWRAFIETPIDSGGLDISKSWANELVSVYEKYVKELKQPESLLMEIPARKLYVLKERVTEKNVLKLISAARHTPLKELILERDGVDEETCKHQYEHFKRCKICKRWTKQ